MQFPFNVTREDMYIISTGSGSKSFIEGVGWGGVAGSGRLVLIFGGRWEVDS